MSRNQKLMSSRSRGGEYFQSYGISNKKGILSQILWQNNEQWCTQFLPFHNNLKQSFFLFPPLMIQSFCLYTPQKIVHGWLEKSVPQQQQQHFPLPDLSAAPQIKKKNPQSHRVCVSRGPDAGLAAQIGVGKRSRGSHSWNIYCIVCVYMYCFFGLRRSPDQGTINVVVVAAVAVVVVAMTIFNFIFLKKNNSPCMHAFRITVMLFLNQKVFFL